MPRIGLICLAVKYYIPVFTRQALEANLVGRVKKEEEELILHRGHFMKLHSKLHLTFIP